LIGQAGSDVTRRTVSRIGFFQRRRPASRLGVVLAVLALSLRLAWPAPQPTVVPAYIGGVAVLGAHALCLAAPAATDPAPVSGDQLPPPAGNHADHDHLLCCFWHANAGFVAPQIESAARIVFVEAVRPFAAAPADFQPASLTGPSRARGPPGEA
jgi:hypothetical protein